MFAFGSLLTYLGFLLKFNSCRLSSFLVLVFMVWFCLWVFKHLQLKLESKEISRSSSRSILAKGNASAKHSWQALLVFFTFLLHFLWFKWLQCWHFIADNKQMFFLLQILHHGIHSIAFSSFLIGILNSFLTFFLFKA